MSVINSQSRDAIDELGATLPRLSPDQLDRLIRDGSEIAVIDVREEQAYGKDGHILRAVSVPLSQLELRIATLVPRPGTRTVVYDGGDEELANRAAGRLASLDYTAVSVLSGGGAAWVGAGKELFTGANVISKAFGEFVQDEYDTPRIQVDELKAKIDAGEDIVILDSRPLDEYEAVSIPGGIDCPGAELVYRAHDLVERPDTLVVVNCAGRTRAIVGAQALLNAGFPNPVIGLENGTSAWLFAGYEPARGKTTHAPAPTAAGLAEAKAGAERIAKRFGVRQIDDHTLERFRAEDQADSRTLYLLDIRTPPEFEDGHLRGSRSAPGGQVVQALDQYVGTNRARIVLIDGADAVRATVTASWLIQFGLDDVYVYPGLDDARAAGSLETGAVPGIVLGREDTSGNETIRPEALQALLAADKATVVDLAKHAAYEHEHITGSWFAIRSRLAKRLGDLPDQGAIVLTSPDGLLADLAADEVARATDRRVLVLDGGTEAWKGAGLSLESGAGRQADHADDSYGPPADLEERRTWYADYVQWGREVVAKIDRDGSLTFRKFT